jgi:hypothetical protein
MNSKEEQNIVMQINSMKKNGVPENLDPKHNMVRTLSLQELALWKMEFNKLSNNMAKIVKSTPVSNIIWCKDEEGGMWQIQTNQYNYDFNFVSKLKL